jgi:hypothetical protein
MHENTQRIFSASFFSIKVFVAFFVLHRFLYRYFLCVPIFCCLSSRPFLWSVLNYSFSQTLLLSRKLLYMFSKSFSFSLSLSPLTHDSLLESSNTSVFTNINILLNIIQTTFKYLSFESFPRKKPPKVLY